MGHSSIQVTFDTYGHLFPQLKQEAVTKLDATLSAALSSKSLGSEKDSRVGPKRPFKDELLENVLEKRSSAGKNGVCRPRQGTLALEFGVHRQRINERLGVLEEKGFISSKRTPGAKRYYINLPLVTGRDVRQTRHLMSDKPDTEKNTVKEEKRDLDCLPAARLAPTFPRLGSSDQPL